MDGADCRTAKEAKWQWELELDDDVDEGEKHGVDVDAVTNHVRDEHEQPRRTVSCHHLHCQPQTFRLDSAAQYRPQPGTEPL